MDKIDVMKLARGMSDYGRDSRGRESFDFDEHSLNRFAALVMEECAKVADSVHSAADLEWIATGTREYYGRGDAAEDIAAAIRERKPTAPPSSR